MTLEFFQLHDVKKRDGSIVTFDENKIIDAISKAFESTGNVFTTQIRNNLIEKILELLATSQTTTKNDNINIEDIQDLVEIVLIKQGYISIAKEFMKFRGEKTELRNQKKKLLNVEELSEVEKRYSYSALKIFTERYLLKDNNGNICERLDDLFKRVAVTSGIMEVLYDPQFYNKSGKSFIDADYQPRLETYQEYSKTIDYKDLPTNEYNIQLGNFTVNIFHQERLLARYIELQKENKMKIGYDTIEERLTLDKELQERILPKIQQYYDLMANKIFLPNTPTLMNAGAKLGQLSACFTLEIKDSVEDIYDTKKDFAIIFKSGGGVGVNYDNLRPEGALIKSTGGVSPGAVHFLENLNTDVESISQGGKRRGAAMGILSISHPDIVKFIKIKNNKTKRLEGHNISTLIDNKFFHAFFKNEKYELTFKDTVYGSINAREMMNMITTNAFECGDPGAVFLENINSNNLLQSIFKVPIKETNPCLTGSTRLATSKGLLKMEDLYLSGQHLQVTTDNRIINNDGKEIGIESRNAVPVYKTSDNADVWIIETDNGYVVEATDNHIFFIQKEISNRHQKKEILQKQVKELKVGDRLLIQSDEGYFGNQGSKELGAVIGWWQADGTSSKTMDWRKENVKTNIILDFYKQDKEISGLFTEYTNKILPQTKSKSGLQTIAIRPNIGGYRDCHSLASTRLGDLFQSLNVQKYSIPEIIWQGSRECVVSYLQAIFTADGTVFGSLEHHDFSIRLASVHRDFLLQVQTLLSNFGISSKIRSARKESKQLLPMNNGSGQYKEYPCKEFFELMIIGKGRHKFTQEIGFLLKYKQEKAEKFSKAIGSDNRISDYCTKIKSITYKGKEPVYDTTVPNNNSFIANGIVVHNCSEIAMYPYDSCNLASINLTSFYNPETNQFDIEEFVRVCKIVTRFLDGVIDANNYPLDKINKVSKDGRRIGLGYMGLGDVMTSLGIPYNSEQGFTFIEYITSMMTYASLGASIELAGEKGPFPLYNHPDYKSNKTRFPVNAIMQPSLMTDLYKRLDLINDSVNLENFKQDFHKMWYDIDNKIGEDNGLRNCSVTTVAPTGTLSMFVDCSSGVEPVFSHGFTKNVTVGEFNYINKYLEMALKKEGIYSEKLIDKIVKENAGRLQNINEIPEHIKKIFVTSMEIHPFDHIAAQSVAQRWITNGISKTINAPNDMTSKEIEYCYVLAWALGCKGTTIYRDGSKHTQVLNNSSINKQASNLQMSDYTRSMIKNNNRLSTEYKEDILSNYTPIIEYKVDSNSNNSVLLSLPVTVATLTGLTCNNCFATNSVIPNGSKGCQICQNCGNKIGSCE